MRSFYTSTHVLEEEHIWANLKEPGYHHFLQQRFRGLCQSLQQQPQLWGDRDQRLGDRLGFAAWIDPTTPRGNPIFNWNIQNLKSAVHVEGTLNNPK